MKTKGFLTVVMVVWFSSTAFGQSDSIRERILRYKDSQSIMIAKGREMLFDYFLEEDMATVKEVKDYLVTLEGRDYMAFYPAELWMLLLWTREYRELETEILRFDTTSYIVYHNQLRPLRDMLYGMLTEKTLVNESSLRQHIAESEVAPETKHLTLLVLDWLLLESRNDIYAQDHLNERADAFMEAYPQSELNSFVREYIRLNYVPAEWGIGFEYFTGYGLLTGNLTKHYTHNVPIGMALSISFRNLEFHCRLYNGFSKTRRDMPYSLGIFEKGSWVNVVLPEMSLGYVIYQNNRIKLTPFAGIGWMGISPDVAETEKAPELKEVALGYSVTQIVGYNVDIKFGPKNPPVYDPKTSYCFVRIRYGYTMPQFEKRDKGISGNMHYITIGIGLEGRGKTPQT